MQNREPLKKHMAHPAVDKFGKLIVNQLRDNAIEHFDEQFTDEGWIAKYGAFDESGAAREG